MMEKSKNQDVEEQGKKKRTKEDIEKQLETEWPSYEDTQSTEELREEIRQGEKTNDTK